MYTPDINIAKLLTQPTGMFHVSSEENFNKVSDPSVGYWPMTFGKSGDLQGKIMWYTMSGRMDIGEPKIVVEFGKRTDYNVPRKDRNYSPRIDTGNGGKLNDNGYILEYEIVNVLVTKFTPEDIDFIKSFGPVSRRITYLDYNLRWKAAA